MPVQPLCFFDMDRTLIATNSGVSFMRYSHRRGKTSRWKVVKSTFDYFRYRFNLLDMEKAYRESLKSLAGVKEEDLIVFCQEWFEEAIKDLVYAEAREAVNHHLAKGETTVIISNSMTYAIDPLARHLGIHHILGTRLEVYDGFFTGRYIKPLCFGPGKIFWAEKIIRERGGGFNQTTFYTDSITDLPLLERVKYPRIVNPDPRLRALARKRGWPVQYFHPPEANKRK